MISNNSGYLKEVSKNDCKLIFHWSNDPEVRKNSLTKNKITFVQHKKWFYSKINEDNSFMWIYFLKNNQPSGLIRFESISNRYFISYLLDSNYRGKKISKKMIIHGIEKFAILKPKVKKIFAKVLKDNLISFKVLKSIGFKLINNNEAVCKLFYEIKNETR